jgi:UrcA family protein
MDIQTVADLRAALRNGILGVIVSSSPTLADVPSPAVETRTAQVSLADIDLSTAMGQLQARDRLHETARRLCARVADAEDLSHQPNFVACVHDSLAAALKQLGTARVALDRPAAHGQDPAVTPTSAGLRQLQRTAFAAASHMTTDEHSSP